MDNNIIIKSWRDELVEGEQADVSVFSDAITDDEGELIKTDGLDWSVWEKLGKPIMLSHSTGVADLVGHGLWVKQKGSKWIGKSKYKPEWWDVAKELKGKSISGIIEKSHPATPEEKAQYGERTRRVIDAVSIREVSICVIPINPSAVTLALSKGLKLSPESLQMLGYSAQDDMKVQVEKASKILLSLDYGSIAQRALARILGRDV